MRILVDECLPRQLRPWLLALRPDGEKTIMDLSATSDWLAVKLVDVVAEQGVTRHVFGRLPRS